jgi:hypothetical protein
MLFAAEASHVAMNRVFQVKAGPIALGILNALAVARPAVSRLAGAGPNAALPVRVPPPHDRDVSAAPCRAPALSPRVGPADAW